MGGLRGLTSSQLGLEATQGVAVPATTVLRGPAVKIKDARGQVRPKEDVAILGGTTRRYVSHFLAELEFPEREATFEQDPLLYNMGIKSLAAGVADGAGSGKIYAFPLGLTAANTLKTATLETADNVQEYEAAFCFLEEITWKWTGGESGGGLMVLAKGKGDAMVKGTKTPALQLPPVKTVVGTLLKMYVDPVGAGTIGTTPVSNSLIAADITLKTGWNHRFEADGQRTYSRLGGGGNFELSAKLTFEHNAAAVARFDAFQAGTPELVRLEALGEALTTPGTAHSFFTWRMDMPGVWDDIEAIGEQNGNNIYTGTYTASYDETEALGPSVLVVNERATLP